MSVEPHPNTLNEEELRALLSGQGPFPTRAADDPALIRDVLPRLDRTYDVDALIERLRSSIAEDATEGQVLAGLRRFKLYETMRVFVREIQQSVGVRQTTAEIADIAEATLTLAVEHAARLLDRPEIADQFCVLGMGKLGGHELNFSSDVDLIYVCSDDIVGEDGPLFERLAKLVTRLMDETTPDGYVFRVDLRLRPEGARGPIVQCVEPMIGYYSNWGRTWERSALIKARPVAGNHAVGQLLLEQLEPFIFRKYLDYEALEELRSMKDAINRNAQVSAVVGVKHPAPVAKKPLEPETPLKARLKNKLSGASFKPRHRKVVKSAEPNLSEPQEVDITGVLGWDVKIGIGGIREIEFFVQALQLVHCGTRPNLRVKNTLEALDRLLYSGLISDDDHRGLADAYAFLRLVEHRIQMQHDRQGHQLPTTSRELAVLATRLGLTEAELRTALSTHRNLVQRLFSRLFVESEQEEDKPTLKPDALGAFDTVLGGSDMTNAVVLKALTTVGFQRPRQVAGQIAILKDKAYGPFSARSTAKQTELATYLLQSASTAPDPDQAFSQLTRFLTLVGDRPGFYSMLADNPHATRLLLHVFGSSAYLSAALLREPAIFSRLVGAGTVAIRRTRGEMLADVQSMLAPVEDPEHRMGIIRRFHQEETLRIGLHETGGATSVMVSTEQLSLLAEVVIETVIQEVYEPLRTRRRRPGSVLPALADIPFGVVAMGKLGGRELGFGSDLDLIFVYEDERQWKLEHSFYSRLAQRIVRSLSSAGSDGKMYEVDTRLRPSGQQGALVVSLEAFERHHLERADLWERQALLRARLIFGSKSLHKTFEKTRQRLAFDRPLPADTNQEIAAMLDRIRGSVSSPKALDVKFSPGALLEVEFVVQTLQLRLGTTNPKADRGFDSALSSNTLNAIRGLGAAKLSEDLQIDFDQLAHDYLRLRVLEARLRIAEQRGTSEIPRSGPELDRLARRVGFTGAEGAERLLEEFNALCGRVVAFSAQVFALAT